MAQDDKPRRPSPFVARKLPRWATGAAPRSRGGGRSGPVETIASILPTWIPRLITRIPGFGIPTITVTARGLAPGGCSHFLPANRLDWWHAVPWPLGPITIASPDFSNPMTFNSDTVDVFCCEFNPALATIVGADLSDDALANAPDGPRLLPYVRIPWDVFSDAQLAQGVQASAAVQDMGFSVSTTPPSSVPRLRKFDIFTADGTPPAPATVIVNDDDRATPDPNAFRPDLVFNAHQRAVGIEYVYINQIGQGARDPSAHGIELRAYASEAAGVDDHFVRSDGFDLFGPDNRILNQQRVHYIGVRDDRGRIKKVALRFLRDREEQRDDPGLPIRSPQIVRRVWHEPLPPVVMTQGSLEASWDGVALSVSGGAASVPLPFRCDLGFVMMRGFKVELPYGADPINGFGVRIESQQDLATELRLRVDGSPSSSQEQRGVPAYTLRVYYTLLAWNTELVELGSTRGDTHLGPIAPTFTGPDGLEIDFFDASTTANLGPFTSLNDPQLDHAGYVLVPDACGGRTLPPGVSVEELCGPVSGALDSVGFGFAFDQDQDLNYWEVIAGTATRHRPALILVVGDDRHEEWSGDDGQIGWPIMAGVFGSAGQHNEGTIAGAGGRIISGRSLVIGGPDFPAEQIVPDPIGWRSDGAFLSFLDTLGNPIEPIGQVEADMAFLSLGGFAFQPQGPLRQLDVEVHGVRYDGHQLVWELGGGVSTASWISGGSGLGAGDVHYFLGWPRFAGIVRKDRLDLLAHRRAAGGG